MVDDAGIDEMIISLGSIDALSTVLSLLFVAWWTLLPMSGDGHGRSRISDTYRMPSFVAVVASRHSYENKQNSSRYDTTALCMRDPGESPKSSNNVKTGSSSGLRAE